MADGGRRGSIIAKVAATLLLVVAGEVAVDADAPVLGAVFGGLAVACLVALLLTRPAVWHRPASRVATLAAGGLALVLIDDPSPMAALLFATALSLASLLTRREFDNALVWALRLVWHGLTAPLRPLADSGRIAALRSRRGGTGTSMLAVVAMLAIPIGGGALFVALFAGANPLIADALDRIALPVPETLVWRSVLAVAIAIAVWTTLRPASRTTAFEIGGIGGGGATFAPGVATLTLSLVTFNLIFAVQNALDVVFLWSGAPLPAGVTMADYAHRGAYALIVTALLAGAFVLVALRSGSPAAKSPAVRRLVMVWILQNLLLVGSSALRTLDYVDAYGMTVLRLSALAWMALVASGLALIGWRLLARRSAAWLINANALAAALVLGLASVVDLGATAAAWNARVALTRGRTAPPLDLCYMARLGPSALVSLARLERRAGDPALRDRLAYLRTTIQAETEGAQANWHSWTPRAGRRLGEVEAIVGTPAPTLRTAPTGRSCGGSILPPPAIDAGSAKPLTAAPRP